MYFDNRWRYYHEIAGPYHSWRPGYILKFYYSKLTRHIYFVELTLLSTHRYRYALHNNISSPAIKESDQWHRENFKNYICNIQKIKSTNCSVTPSTPRSSSIRIPCRFPNTNFTLISPTSFTFHTESELWSHSSHSFLQLPFNSSLLCHNILLSILLSVGIATGLRADVP